MKKILNTVLFLMLSFVVFGQTTKNAKAKVKPKATAVKPAAASTGMVFSSESWDKILERAKKEKKLIFFDAYTSWCGPCKKMQREIFTQAEVGAFFNKNFINVKRDMEEGEGLMLAQRYPIEGYPKLFILNANGDMVQTQLGAIPADKFISFGKSALK